MAIFNPQLSQAPSTFNPIPDPVDSTVPNTINKIAGLTGNLVEAKNDHDEAVANQAAAEGYASLFSDTIRSEAAVIEGQERLTANQKRFDQLYADGIINEEEQKELNTLMQERRRLESVTNNRTRQVQLRMKYANFVNRFPHLTKEARILFGEAESRLEDIAQGQQALVDQEAFETIFGKNYTAENISTFRNLQKFKAQREIGATYGEANFQDWQRNFQADVTAELFTIGKRTQNLLQQQGSLRTEDIDVFNAGIREGYMTGVRQIDMAVQELRKNGQYVSDEQIQSAKQELVTLRDDMLKMTEGTDFATRLENFNRAQEEILKHTQNMELGPIAKLFAGEGGGGAKGAADLATIRQLFVSGGTDAAANLPAPYGDQVRMMREGAAKYLTFLDEYDSEAAAQFVSPAMARQPASIQGRRIDNGLTRDNPEAVKTLIDTMEQGGTSDETAEGLLSRSKVINEAAIRNNEAKARLSSFVNNYALETQEFLRDVNGRIRQTENGPEVVVSQGGGRFVRNAQGTAKLRNLQQIYKDMPAIGDLNQYNSIIDQYTTERNSTLQSAVQELREAVQTGNGINEQLLSMNLRQLKLQYGLTDQEVAQISSQVRSSNGAQASGDGD